MTVEEIRLVVRETIKELKDNELLADKNTFKYAEGAKMLRAYYDTGGQDACISGVMDKLSHDLYSDILPMFYRDGVPMETLAENYGVDVTTAYRNKKRLVIALYDAITQF